ncbi:flagellar basal body P-ring protein FlgI [Gimesia aquarii]|uniref:Flagellar basal body P-ring protein n=1 Tax=Gimesia aquarii TaxID=2527964 RepID=A0A517X1T6_9PLAN|nr:flagellar basal body P-ring protein FlgI [Gimesia aquarii]QDU11474.1 flagellar basal body P-ring protein [Gimesia aquarii]
MRYFKFSILTGIGLFALAMFFLSQSIQGFLEGKSDSTETTLDVALSEPSDFPDLSLDFPAGTNQSQIDITDSEKIDLPSQTSLTPSAMVAHSNNNQTRDQFLPENSPPQINLVTASNQLATAPPALNILLLSQTTREQRTSLIEELLRVDAELVRQIAFKPAIQPTISATDVKTVQQISMSTPVQQQTVSAGYTVTQQPRPDFSTQAPLVRQKNPIHLIASYRGVTIKTVGIPIQSGTLHQTIQVTPVFGDSIFQASILGKNRAELKIHSELSLPKEIRMSPEMKLSQLGEFQPAEIIKISGAGLVIGLNGTGDHSYSAEAIKALNSSVKTMNIDLKKIKNPIRAGNLANVSIIAYVPNTGVKKGQYLECYITAVNKNVDLSGGYLLPTALLAVGSRKIHADAMAMGPVLTNQSRMKSQGIIPKGSQFLTNLKPKLISDNGIPHLNFFLSTSNSQPQISQLITQRINQFLQSQPSIHSKAILRSSSMISISVPNSNQQLAHQLVSQLQSLPIPIQPVSPANQSPEVVIDFAKSKIQTRGNVLLDPAKLEYSDFVLEITPLPSSTTCRLNDLLALMHHLQIPKPKQMTFVRELQQQGKIKATYRAR